MPQINFPELLAQAREIDKGIAFLKDKLLEPSKFGSGKEAFNAIQEVNKEVTSIKENCCSDLNKRNKELESVLDCNKMVNGFLDTISDVLDDLETKAKDFGYQPFETHSTEHNGNVGKNQPDYINVSGVERLSIYDSDVTPMKTHQQHAISINRRYHNRFNDESISPFTLSSCSGPSPFKSTPRIRYENSFLSSTTREDIWLVKPQLDDRRK